MKSIFNTKNKLTYIFINTEKNFSDIVKSQQQDKLQDKNFNKNKVVNLHFKKINDFNYEWENLDTDVSLNKQYKNWVLIFERFDIRLLPFLDIKILYRRGDGLIADNRTITPYIQKVFQIEDLENETTDYYKKITCKISLYYESSGLQEIYQSKLKLFFPFPRNY